MIEARRSTVARLLPRVADALGRRGRRQFARLSARSGAGLILLYHRIASPAEDPWHVAVSEATFDRHLQFLTAEYTVLPLAELVAASRRGRIPERAVAITFDDGYADNLARALPLLEEHRAPATLYVSTGYIESSREFWWDEMTDILTGPGPYPASLRLELGGTLVSAPVATVPQRRAALRDVIHPALRACDPDSLSVGLRRLRAWAGAAAEAPSAGLRDDPLRRPMTVAELESFAASEVVDLGAHTVSHPGMVGLDPDIAMEEVAGSRRYLTELLGSPPASFSYPFGDNSAASRRVVRSAGFDHAFGVRWDTPLTAAARRFELPRLMVVEEDESALQARMLNTLAFRGQPS